MPVADSAPYAGGKKIIVKEAHAMHLPLGSAAPYAVNGKRSIDSPLSISDLSKILIQLKARSKSA
jgi:hypothetical protein